MMNKLSHSFPVTLLVYIAWTLHFFLLLLQLHTLTEKNAKKMPPQIQISTITAVPELQSPSLLAPFPWRGGLILLVQCPFVFANVTCSPSLLF
jgi:hypothetical protein